MDPREYDWQIADLARQDIYPDETAPPSFAMRVHQWMNQPSWLEKAATENKRTLEAYNRGGMGEIARLTPIVWRQKI